MFDLLILLSRYLYAIYIILFLWYGAVYIFGERGRLLGNPTNQVSKQRIIIVLFHLTSFLILSYNPGELSFNKSSIVVGIVGLFFIFFVNFTSEFVYRDSCPLIWNGMVFLLDLGLVMLQRLNPVLASRQLLWCVISYVMILLIPLVLKIVPQFEKLKHLYIFLSYVLIISTLLFGDTQFGSQNWIQIGPIGFQPSEVVKFLYIFYLASVFRKRVELKELLTTGILCGGIVIMLVLQKDLGSALIFFMTYLIMLYVATSNGVLLALGFIFAALASVIAFFLFSHVRVRFYAWKNPWADINSTGYQITQSLFALCTWGLFGAGLTKGVPNKIPVVERDFIFSAIAEELGLIFAIGVICIFIMIFLREIIVALNCKRRFYSLLVTGIVTIFSIQTFLVIGGVTKLIPHTGVTLPLISYGGSSVLISIFMIGLLQWINVYCKRMEMLKESEQIGDNYA